MTPAARVAAAIDLLDTILAGTAAEQALTAWARRSRFAGSGDRAALRDLVFDALRRRRSYAALGGADTGRGLMLGALRAAQADPDEVFTGAAHAPPPLTTAETTQHATLADQPAAIRGDIPDWLLPAMERSLGDATGAALAALRDRAPVHLRVNLARGDRAGAIRILGQDGITAIAHPQVGTALDVTENARRIASCAAYRDGLVELQDAASQAAVLRLPLAAGQRVLDYCAGGGGKALAIAALADVAVTAHDIDPRRMADLPGRAARAGCRIALAATATLPSAAPWDIVLCDAPCTGSGTWRRAPDAKWRLTPDRLAALCRMQNDVLAAAAPLVAPGGVLAYATCSVLEDENGDRIAAFLKDNPGWCRGDEMRLHPGPLWDGFYLACLTRNG